MSIENSIQNLSPYVIRRVQKELRELRRKPIPGVTLLEVQSCSDIEFEIEGPENTPYSGGTFVVRISLSSGYPSTPPKGLFITKIFHPNVSQKGNICVNVLKKDWKPDMGFAHILTIVRCLLIHPNPDSALNEMAGRLLREDYESFARQAMFYTKIHAKSKVTQKPTIMEPKTVSDHSNPYVNAASSSSDIPSSIPRIVPRICVPTTTETTYTDRPSRTRNMSKDKLEATTPNASTVTDPDTIPSTDTEPNKKRKSKAKKVKKRGIGRRRL